MSPAIKYGLARLGLFIACAVPLALLLPDVDLLLRLLIAVVVSAALSFFLLRKLRDQVADGMSTNARRKVEERARLRSALAGDDEPAPVSSTTTDAPRAATPPRDTAGE